MKEVIDVIAVVIFVFILFIIIAGFNRQMVEKNMMRKEMQEKRERERLAEIEKKQKAKDKKHGIKGDK